MKRLFIALLFMLGSFVAAAQCDSSKYLVGLNLTPLETGLPELQLGWFPVKYLGVTGQAGAALRYPGNFYRVESSENITSFKGSWFKIGLMAQHNFCSNGKDGTFYLSLLYSQSQLREQGGFTDTSLVVDNKFNASGACIGLGALFRIAQSRFYLRVGTQYSIFARKTTHLKAEKTMTQYMPGYSSSALFNMQGQIGLCYRFGHRWTEEQREVVK